MKKAPCMNCEKRKVGCHSKCKEYAEYDRQNRKKRAERMMETVASPKIWKRK